MESDIILTSQPSCIIKDDSPKVSAETTDFHLFVDEEESDWESESDENFYIPSSMDESKSCYNKDVNNDIVISEISANELSCVSKYFSEEAPLVSFKSGKSVISSFEGSCGKRTWNEEGEASKMTSSLTKCKTDFSQNIDVETFQKMSQTHAVTASEIAQQSFGLMDSETMLDIISSIKTNKTRKLGNLKLQDQQLSMCNIIASVVISYPIREVWCKSVKRWKPMAVIMLADYSNTYIKLTLWNNLCHHALSLRSGQVIYINSLEKRFVRNESYFVLKPTSKIISICSAPNLTHSSFHCCLGGDLQKEVIDVVKLNWKWFVDTHKTLSCVPLKNIHSLTNNVVKFKDIVNMECGEVIHTRVKIAATSNRERSSSVICVHNLANPRTCCNLYLNGSASQWTFRFKRFANHTWEFRNLACCLSWYSNRVELHTTLFSTAECMFSDGNEGNSSPLTLTKTNILTVD